MVSVLLMRFVCGCSNASLSSFCLTFYSKQAPFKCHQWNYLSKLEPLLKGELFLRTLRTAVVMSGPLTVANIHTHVQAGFGEVN